MREIKSFIKSASFNELEKAAELINEALDSQREQQQVKDEVLALIKEKGLTLEDLVGGAQSDKRAKVKAKYRIEKRWASFLNGLAVVKHQKLLLMLI